MRCNGPRVTPLVMAFFTTAALSLVISVAHAQVATLMGAPIPDMESVQNGSYALMCHYSAPFENTDARRYWKIPALVVDGRADCPLELRVLADGSYVASRATLLNPHPDRPVVAERPPEPLSDQEIANEAGVPVCRGEPKVCVQPERKK